MPRRLRLPSTVLAFAVALLVVLPRAALGAPEDDARGGVSLGQAVEAGARRGPAVIEASRARQAAVAFADRPGSSLPSLPQATVLVGARAPNRMPWGPEVVVTVQQEIALRRLGDARARAAEWTARVAASDVERGRLEGGTAAALAWVDLLEAQSLLVLRAAASEDAARLARIAEVRVASGASTSVERSLASAEVGASRLAILEGEGRATEARIALAHAIGGAGRALDERLFAAGSLEATDEAPVDADTVVRSSARHPVVVAAEARAAQAEAEAKVAHAAAGPTFALGASAWREGSRDYAAAALVSVPLPFFDPARYDVGRQSVVSASAGGHASRLRAALERDARLALHEREHAREVRAQLREGVVVPLRSALATAMTAYAAGADDLSVVLLARRSTFAAEERLVSAMADVLRADVRLAAVHGTLVRGGQR